MEARRSTETLITTYKSTRCRNLEEHNRRLHHHENHESYNVLFRSLKFLLTITDYVYDQLNIRVNVFVYHFTLNQSSYVGTAGGKLLT